MEIENMLHFYGTKKIAATPMTRGEYNKYRGWEIPSNEDASEQGYLVEYLDGGKGNDTRHIGYITWTPKEPFEKAYQPLDALNFGHALEALKAGKKVARKGWNGKNMFIFLVPGSTFKVNRAPLLGIYPEGTEINYHGHIDMRTADGQIVPWLASQTDVQANDWQVLPD